MALMENFHERHRLVVQSIIAPAIAVEMETEILPSKRLARRSADWVRICSWLRMRSRRGRSGP
jgi:hypothetical protein